MKVFLEVMPPTLSRAMHRVARGLKDTCPKNVQLVDNPRAANLVVLHVTGDGNNALKLTHHPKNYVVIQYCHNSASASTRSLQKLWESSRGVWSYYDLRSVVPRSVPFYKSPLGLADVFRDAVSKPNGEARDIGVFTSGYLTGKGAEAIEEVAVAADRRNLSVTHLGPSDIEGMTYCSNHWTSVSNVSDNDLVSLYSRSKWVSGLRFIEGFELPIIEGLCCGARPIVFDRPEMREWFDGHAVFIPEVEGGELVARLEEVLAREPEPVTLDEKRDVLEKFDWEHIAPGFWKMILNSKQPPQIVALRSKFEAHWQTSKLVGISPDEFERKVRSFVGVNDSKVEGWKDGEGQRDMSVQFSWGHDHDFGSFSMNGLMGDRHLRMINHAINHGALSHDLQGKKVLDVGCWTGGTSLMLKAMGADVTAVEEVRKYAECVRYLRDSFRIDGLRVLGKSFYELWNDPEFQDAFDITFIPGVLYHVTDLHVFLRIMFNALKDGGVSFVETEVYRSKDDVIRYIGSSVFNRGGTREQMNRSGWNYFQPAPHILKRIYEEVGFVDVKISDTGPREFIVARREKHVPICRAGLSFRDIR